MGSVGVELTDIRMIRCLQREYVQVEMLKKKSDYN